MPFVYVCVRARVCVCVCERERESVCVSVCVRERERERESTDACVFARVHASICVYLVCTHACYVSVCTCVCVILLRLPCLLQEDASVLGTLKTLAPSRRKVIGRQCGDIPKTW